MIVRVAITNSVTRTVTGIERNYAPVCEDLSEGWTLIARDDLADRPDRLQMIGRRYTYIALLEGSQLLLIGARKRKPWDGSEEDVLRTRRYYEPFQQSHDNLDQHTLAILTERWEYAHAQREAMNSGQIAHWKQLNRIRSFVAHEHGAVVNLAEHPCDTDRLAEGQLVLRTRDPTASAIAAKDFVYRLPNLDVPLRVEDIGEGELILDCGEHDLVRVEQYLRANQDRPLRLTLDREETDRQIERERRTLKEAETDSRLRALIATPTLARTTPERTPVPFFNKSLDDSQQQVVRAAIAADDLLIVQGPPGTGKTTAICEIARQTLARNPHAQILIAAQTHQAVDNVLLRLAKEDPDLPIARVASIHTIDRVDEQIRERYWTHSPDPWHPPIVKRAIAYRQLIDAQVRAGDRGSAMPDIMAIQEDYLASVGPQRSPHERLAQARVIAGTCAGIQGNPEVRALVFATAILEEAGKASAPEALMLALRSKKAILVGDSRQLPPQVWGPMQEVLRKPSLLTSANPNRQDDASEIRGEIEKLGSTPEERERADQETLFDHLAARLQGTPHETALRTQYRMLPEIGELVSQVFYRDTGGLEHGRSRPIDPRVQAFAGQARIKLLDIPGEEQHEGKSAYRTAEIDHIRTELKALNEAATKTPPPPHGPARLGVAIITPYAAQARRLRASIDLTKYPALNVRVGIVDRFQGDEDQVVILSVAATTAAGFLKIPNRINVAISRAQDLLILTTSLHPAIQGKIGTPLQHVARFIDARVKAADPGYEIHRMKQPKPQSDRPQRRRGRGRRAA